MGKKKMVLKAIEYWSRQNLYAFTPQNGVLRNQPFLASVRPSIQACIWNLWGFYFAWKLLL